MDGTPIGVEQQAFAPSNGVSAPRRRRHGTDANLRYFLIKPGSSPAKPELGPEVASEGEALIEALTSGQPFYTVTAWKAVPELNGGNPVIVKQAVARQNDLGVVR